MAENNTFVVQIQQFIDSARIKASDGLSLTEAGQIIYGFILLAVELASQLQNAGPEKKALVMEALGVLYDTIAPAVPLPFYLKILYPFVAGSLRTIFVQLSSGAIEAALTWIRQKAAT